MVPTEARGKATKKKKEIAAPKTEEAGTRAAKAAPKGDGRRPLIIVESPAKARTLNGFLRGRFHVEASMGHLVDLPERTLGVKIDQDFEPEYRAIPGRRDIIAKLKEAGKNVTEVLLATDPDREGEAIAWHVAHQVLDRPDSRRIEFHEITRAAIERALEHPRSIDENLVEAQQARRILDRLVGYLLSPMLWKKVQRGLSAGRVQSVAVRLVCDRENEIRKFVPEEFWNVQAEFAAPDGTHFKAALTKVNGEKLNVTVGDEAHRLVEDIRKQAYAIATIEREPRDIHPRAPFITSTLQQEASRRLSMSPRKTMQVAQRLYEGVDLGKGHREGLITYMRTDSVRVADEALYALRDHIQGTFGDAYLPEKPHYYKTRETAQGAHEAIRPTLPLRAPDSLASLISAEDLRLYALIWGRFIASQMASAQVEKLTVAVAGGPYLFEAEGERLLFDGFFKVLPEKHEKNPELRGLTAGPVELAQVLPEQKFTQPPARYTVAALIKTLEEKGIGRPSTYAPIIQTIQDREYVLFVRRKRKEETGAAQETPEGEEETPAADAPKDPKDPRPGTLVPTPLGERINTLLVDHFGPILEYDFTAELEEKLDKVEEGKLGRVALLREFFGSFNALLEKAKAEIQTQKKPAVPTDILCPLGHPMVIREGRYGRFLACSEFPKHRYTRPLQQLSEAPATGGLRDLASGVTTTTPRKPRGAAAPAPGGAAVATGGAEAAAAKKAPRSSGEPTEIVCEKCGGKMVIRAGRYGKFLACSNYPKCKNTKPLEQAAVKGKCPKCGSALSVKRSRKGRRTFFGCSTYPACDFATWNTPTDEACPSCGSTLFKTGKGELVCHKPDCPAGVPTK